MNTHETSGATLRDQRKRARVTILALAEATGWHRSTIWRYEAQAVVDDEIASRYRESLDRLTKVVA